MNEQGQTNGNQNGLRKYDNGEQTQTTSKTQLSRSNREQEFPWDTTKGYIPSLSSGNRDGKCVLVSMSAFMPQLATWPVVSDCGFQLGYTLDPPEQILKSFHPGYNTRHLIRISEAGI